MLIETRSRGLTDTLYDRAVKLGHTVRRVILIEYGTLLLDSGS